MAAVTLSNVSKYHNNQLILDSLDLSIQKGEFLAVVGPSGCGKSTLLRLITGLDTVSAGEILINHQCVNNISPAKRDMAMVFQSYALYPHMTVYNNMGYSLKMRGISKKAIQCRIEEVAAMLQLTEFLQRKPAALSGGQRQRVAMGRAIVRNPAVFLFDEPLSNLDAKLRFSMRQEIKKLHQTLQTTCIYVTHDQSEAMGMADRILVLNQGRIEQIGTPKTLYNQPASLFVAEFIGTYPVNLFISSFDSLLGQISINDEVLISAPKEMNITHDKQVIIAVRAEELILSRRGEVDSLPIEINLVDNLGADKLIHARTLKNPQMLTLRVPTNQIIPEDPAVVIPLRHSNVYDINTGLRLGGWDL